MKIAIGIALGASCLIGLAADDKQKPPSAAIRPTLTVNVTTPSKMLVPKVIAANGSLAAWQEAVVAAEVNGLKIKRVMVNVGDRVKRGEVLASLNADVVEAELAQAQAALAEAQANAQEAQAQAERARSLQAQGFFSAAQLSQAQSQNASAQARVQSARAAVQLQNVRLAQTQIKAPDAGVISSRQATEGSVVTAGSELFRLIRQGRLEWRAEVTAAEVGRIPNGAAVQLTAASGEVLQGKVRTIAPSVDVQSRTALVYVDLTTAPGSARAGMYAKGEINAGQSEMLTLPQTAVLTRDGLSTVFLVNDDQKVTAVKVQSGRFVGDRVEVLSGLAPDAKVVLSGGAFLNQGDTVRVVGTNTSAAK